MITGDISMCIALDEYSYEIVFVDVNTICVFENKW